MTRQNIIQSPWFWFAIALLIFIPLVFTAPMPANDTANRYAPMAEAFALGNWEYAFHPRFGVLFSGISGSIAYLFNLNGFRSCQIAAVLLWAAAIFPLYYLAKRLWNDKVTLIAVILYIFCSHLHRYFYDGLRDNGRTVAVLLMGLGLVQFYTNRRSLLGVLNVVIGGALLAMLRADGVLIAAFGLMTVFIWDIIENHWRCYRSLAGGLLFLILLLPQLYLNYQWSGYPVPYSRYAIILEKMNIPPLGEGKR